jgi:hypothetical protein
MEVARLHDMQTTQIIAMIPLSGKRVCKLLLVANAVLTEAFSVCVSSLLVDEIKRIIKTSEIMKYVGK